MFGFDENTGTLYTRTHGMGLQLDTVEGRGKLFVHQVDPGELSPGEFCHWVRESVEKHHARVVVIDSLNGYMSAMPQERFLVIQMHELLTYLAQQGVATILTVAQHGLIGAMQAPVDITYIADTVVLFRFFEATGKVRKAISVLKKRIGAHEDTIREFQLGPSGVRVGAPLSQFRGILTGSPVFVGDETTLFQKRD